MGGGNDYYFYCCGKRQRTRQCDNKRLSASVIEEQILEHIDTALKFSEDDVGIVLGLIKKQMENAPDKLKPIRAERNKVQAEIRNIIQAIKGGANHPMLQEELNRLTDRDAELSKQLGTAVEQRLPSREEIAIFLHSVENIKQMSREQQKELLQRLIDKIVVYDDDTLTVTYRVLNIPMVEVGRVELPSENPKPRLSTSVSPVRLFLFLCSQRKDHSSSSFIVPTALKALNGQCPTLMTLGPTTVGFRRRTRYRLCSNGKCISVASYY